MDTGTDTTVYLPGDLKARAKAAGLNLSGMLREAVTEELDRLEALKAMAGDMAPVTETLGTQDGPLELRFTGRHIIDGGDMSIYLTEDGRVILISWHGSNEDSYDVFEDIDEYGDWLNDSTRNNLGGESEAVVSRAGEMLGVTRVVNL